MRGSYTRRQIGALLGATPLAISVLPIFSQSAWAADDVLETAIDAYIYGYSLITTEVTRVQMSNVPQVEGMRAPTGQFVNVKRYPPANYRGVSAPNADTLYSLAWLDLAAEPIVFSHPDMGDRFYLFEMTDLWMTDFGYSGYTHGRRSGGELSNNRSWLVRNRAGRHEADQVRYALYGYSWPHLC